MVIFINTFEFEFFQDLVKKPVSTVSFRKTAATETENSFEFSFNLLLKLFFDSFGGNDPPWFEVPEIRSMYRVHLILICDKLFNMSMIKLSGQNFFIE